MAGPFNGSERPQRQCFLIANSLANMEAHLVVGNIYWMAPATQGLVRTALEEEKSILAPDLRLHSKLGCQAKHQSLGVIS